MESFQEVEGILTCRCFSYISLLKDLTVNMTKTHWPTALGTVKDKTRYFAGLEILRSLPPLFFHVRVFITEK